MMETFKRRDFNGFTGDGYNIVYCIYIYLFIPIPIPLAGLFSCSPFSLYCITARLDPI